MAQGEAGCGVRARRGLAMGIVAALAAWLVVGGAHAGTGEPAGPGEPGGRVIPLELELAIPQLDLFSVEDGRIAAGEGLNAALRAEAFRLITELAEVGSVWGSYDVHLDHGGLVSITMQYSGYGQYMAHPMHLRASVTADTATGEVFQLADLFTDGRYVEVLSQAVKEGLEKHDLDPLVEFRRIAPDQPFYLTPDALVVYFQLYELLPYAAGFPEFPVPYGVLEPLLKEGGPVSRLLRQR